MPQEASSAIAEGPVLQCSKSEFAVGRQKLQPSYYANNRDLKRKIDELRDRVDYLERRLSGADRSVAVAETEAGAAAGKPAPDMIIVLIGTFALVMFMIVLAALL